MGRVKGRYILLVELAASNPFLALARAIVNARATFILPKRKTD
ncbi:MAG: hypothetical protein WBE46_02300 [Dehalococcoidia bacterium]